MGVTRTSAAEIRQRQLRGRGRDREAVALAIVALLFVAGLVLVQGKMLAPFGDAAEKVLAREVLDLNQLVQPEELIPFLVSVPEAERRFVADEIWRYRNRVGGRPFENVGELARIRIPAGSVPKELAESELGRRATEAATAAEPEGAEATLTLLTQSQLGEIKPSLTVRTARQLRGAVRSHAALLLASFLGVHLLWRWRGFLGDPFVLPPLLGLTALGFLEMLAMRDPLRDQTLFAGFAQGVALGGVLLAGASWIDFERRVFRRASFLFLILAILLSVLLILFGTGPGTSDAKVNLAGFQPVEVIKILLAFFLAGYFSERWELLRELVEQRGPRPDVLRRLRLPRLEYVLPVGVAMALVLAFFFLQRDLGPALVTSLLFLALYGVARGRAGLALAGLAIVGTGFYLGYRLGIPRTVAARVAMWLSPWDNGLFGGDHLAKSQWALATGGITGTGLGAGDPQLVPAVHTDMILAAIGEELGLLGVLAVFALFAFLIHRFLRITLQAGGHYSFFLGLSLTLILALQAILISGGVLGLLPLSGIATPFLSFGRSSMTANLAIAGILLALSHRPGEVGATVRPLHRTVRWITALLVGALVVLSAAAVRIQAVAADSLLIRANLATQGDGVRRYQYNPRLVRIARQIPRGDAVDRNGLILATSDASRLQAHQETYQELGIVTPLPEDANGRIYPLGGLTFHLLGDLRSRLNWAASNTSFAERDHRVRLQGFDDYVARVPVRQPGGEITRVLRRDYRELVPLLRHRGDPEHPGVERILSRDRTLRLSLDARFQARVASVLAEHVRLAGAERGAAVFLDAASGEVLASVSHPWPRRLDELAEGDPADLLDRPRYGLYPPGSVFKLVTATAALRHDPTLATMEFTCSPLGGGRVGQKVRGWGKPIRDDPRASGAHGEVDLHAGIRNSCNAYFAQLATYEVGARALLETAQLMGIQVAHPNTPETLQDSLPQSAFGQGQVTATPLDVARVAATIAAGGRMPAARWVLGDSGEATAPRQILPEPLAGLIAEAMRDVVRSGTGKILNRVTPKVAGKTGTAEVEGRRSHAWFAGFAPADGSGERVLAFSVLIENGGYGGEHAARAAGDMIREAAALRLIAGAEGLTPP